MKKTNKVILLHEATRRGGFAGELAALIAKEAFESLDAPVLRISASVTPVSYNPPLEEYFLPQVESIIIDGAVADHFMADVKHTLENFNPAEI